VRIEGARIHGKLENKANVLENGMENNVEIHPKFNANAFQNPSEICSKSTTKIRARND
jgi:hypothetical protein